MRIKDVKLKKLKYLKLKPTSTYLFQIDTTDMPVKQASELCDAFTEMLRRKNIENVIVYPYDKTHNRGKIEVVELKEK